MRKNCETCKHDDAEYPSYPHKTPCNECEHTSDAPTKWQAADHYKPITNADRIRAMTDEELAKFMNLCGHDFQPYCDVESSISEECDQNCIKCAEEWLKQPAE